MNMGRKWAVCRISYNASNLTAKHLGGDNGEKCSSACSYGIGRVLFSVGVFVFGFEYRRDDVDELNDTF